MKRVYWIVWLVGVALTISWGRGHRCVAQDVTTSSIVICDEEDPVPPFALSAQQPQGANGAKNYTQIGYDRKSHVDARTYQNPWNPWVPGENANCQKGACPKMGVTATYGANGLGSSTTLTAVVNGDWTDGYSIGADAVGITGSGTYSDSTSIGSSVQTSDPAPAVNTGTIPDAPACVKVDMYWRLLVCDVNYTFLARVWCDGTSKDGVGSATAYRSKFETSRKDVACTSGGCP